MKNKVLALLGAGGHGKVCADVAHELGWEVVFYDDAFPKLTECLCWDVVGNYEDFVNDCERYDGLFVAIGNNKVRAEVLQNVRKLGVQVVSLVSIKANVSARADIGQGVLVNAGATINVGSSLADGVIVNTGANVDHDGELNFCCHVSPGANLAGNVRIGAQAWIGIGSAIIQNIQIGENTVVGAGSVIIRDVDKNLVVAGVPATKRN